MKIILPGPVVRLFQGDCREILPAISGVRCCITRPPEWEPQALVNLFCDIREMMTEVGHLILLMPQWNDAFYPEMQKRGWYCLSAGEYEDGVALHWCTRDLYMLRFKRFSEPWPLRTLIDVNSKPRDLILDPFADDGRVLLIARQLDRAVCGIEQDETKCKRIVEALYANSPDNERR